jgi:hypothetical protein
MGTFICQYARLLAVLCCESIKIGQRAQGCKLTSSAVEAICSHMHGLKHLDIRGQQAGTVIGGQVAMDQLLPDEPRQQPRAAYRDRLLEWSQSEPGVFVKVPDSA